MDPVTQFLIWNGGKAPTSQAEVEVFMTGTGLAATPLAEQAANAICQLALKEGVRLKPSVTAYGYRGSMSKLEIGAEYWMVVDSSEFDLDDDKDDEDDEDDEDDDTLFGPDAKNAEWLCLPLPPRRVRVVGAKSGSRTSNGQRATIYSVAGLAADGDVLFELDTTEASALYVREIDAWQAFERQAVEALSLVRYHAEALQRNFLGLSLTRRRELEGGGDP